MRGVGRDKDTYTQRERQIGRSEKDSERKGRGGRKRDLVV